MRRITSYLIVAALAATIGGGITAHASNRPKADTYHGARYALQEDLWGFMYTLRLRHCISPVVEHLQRVYVDRERSLVIYRCVGSE